MVYGTGWQQCQVVEARYIQQRIARIYQVGLRERITNV